MKYDEPKEQNFNGLAASLRKSKSKKTIKYKILEHFEDLQYNFLISVKSSSNYVQPEYMIIYDGDFDFGDYTKNIPIVNNYENVAKFINKHNVNCRFIIFSRIYSLTLIRMAGQFPFVMFYCEHHENSHNFLRNQQLHQSIYKCTSSQFSCRKENEKLIQFGVSQLKDLYYANLVISVQNKCSNQIYQYIHASGHLLVPQSENPNSITESYSKMLDCQAVLNPEEAMCVTYSLPYLYNNHRLFLPVSIQTSNIIQSQRLIGQIRIIRGTQSSQFDLLHQGMGNAKDSFFCKKYYFLLKQFNALQQQINLHVDLWYSFTDEEQFYSLSSVAFSKHYKYFQQFIADNGDNGLMLINESLIKIMDLVGDNKQSNLVELWRNIFFQRRTLNYNDILL